jgi:glycosyltransferase involved in cell wall biosynthesis
VRILCLLAYYLPGYKSGGPVRTVANMVDRLGGDLEFSIVTSDRDYLDDRPYADVAIDEWNRNGNASVFYASPAMSAAHRLARLIATTPHDVLYLNSFFDRRFTIAPLVARRVRSLPDRPTVIAPRGEFSSGALQIRRWKKRVYRSAAVTLGLYDGLIWQASSDFEANDIKTELGGVAKRIVVAPDLLPRFAPVSRRDRARKDASSLHVCFVSRISPKKNLDFALRILARVSVPIVFDIFGPIDDAQYWARCQDAIRGLGANVTVEYKGSVPHRRVHEVFGEYDLFFFPTHGENFGHVVFESLAAGTPVLIADTTPWRNLEQAGVGWDLPLVQESKFVEAIHAAARLTGEQYAAWRARVADYAATLLRDEAVLDANRALFSQPAR